MIVIRPDDIEGRTDGFHEKDGTKMLAANSSEDRNGTHEALDLFVGMVYAVMVGLLVAVAHGENMFSSPWFSLSFFALFFFFAQDWMSRDLGNRRIRRFLPDRVATGPYSLKVFFDVLLIYLLLLWALRLIDLSVAIDNWSFTSMAELLGDRELLATLGVFALVAGVWNWVVIYSTSVVTEEERALLLRGSVPEALLKRNFTKILKWRDDLEIRFQFLARAQALEVERLPTTSRTEPIGIFDGTLLHMVLGLAHIVVGGFKDPLKVLTPYILTLHIVFLNGVLGVILVLSSIMPAPHTSRWLAAPVAAFALLALCGYSIHLSPRPKTGVLVERTSTSLLLISVACVYIGAWSMAPAFLAVLFLGQQLAVNYFMILYFKPSPAGEAVDDLGEDIP